MDIDSATEVLVKCIIVGQSKGAFSIKDASYLYGVITEVKKEEGRTKEKYDAMIRAVVVANSKGCFSLEEASLIEKTVNFLGTKDLITTNEKDVKDVKEV